MIIFAPGNMRKALYKTEVGDLLSRCGIITVADFVSLFPGVPMPTVYARIRSLELSRKISSVGRGRYVADMTMSYKVSITPWMKDVNATLIDACPGVQSCISQRGGNLFVDVPRADISRVLTVLAAKYGKAVSRKDVEKVADMLEGFIIVGHLVSESPLFVEEGVGVPSLEKELVDTLCKGGADGLFRRTFDSYPVNMNRLSRYAARRGVSKELEACLRSIDQSRVSMFNTIRRYLAGLPVEKAWVFGSFSRGEETCESDLDILVSYTSDARISLLSVIRWKKDMENLIGREVDLVEEGYLKPFAVQSANRDRYLIYEKQN